MNLMNANTIGTKAFLKQFCFYLIFLKKQRNDQKNMATILNNELIIYKYHKWVNKNSKTNLIDIKKIVKQEGNNEAMNNITDVKWNSGYKFGGQQKFLCSN